MLQRATGPSGGIIAWSPSLQGMLQGIKAWKLGGEGA